MSPRKRSTKEGPVIQNLISGTARLPYWSQNMEFDIETWVPYSCDFHPIKINSLFSDALGRIAEMALRMESEFLYMEPGDSHPVGTLVPENLIRPHLPLSTSPNFAMVFSYSSGMERLLFDMAAGDDTFGVGITICDIWKSAVPIDACKVLVVASASPLFDWNAFVGRLDEAMTEEGAQQGGNVPYFAERFGYRRCQIPYETDDVTDLLIVNLLASFEFEETRRFVGPEPERSIDDL